MRHCPSELSPHKYLYGGWHLSGRFTEQKSTTIAIVEHPVAYFGQSSATSRWVSRKMTICVQLFHCVPIFGMRFCLFLFRYFISSLLVCQSSVRRHQARIRALGLVRSTSCTAWYRFVASWWSSSGTSSGVEGLQRLQTSWISMCRSKGSQRTPHNSRILGSSSK